MSAVRSLGIGVVLFNDKQSDFEHLVSSLSCASHRAPSVGKIKLFVKWNSRKNFSAPSVAARIAPHIDIFEFDNISNIGFGSAHNILIENCFLEDHDCYLCINPDGFLHPDAIENLVSFMGGRENVGLIEAIQFPREHPKPFDPFTGLTAWCSGACLLIPRATYELIGGFDSNIFMYFEDIDLSWRAIDAGLQCFLCSSALFFHNSNPGLSTQTRRMMYESARYLAQKWHAPDFQSKIEEQLIQENHYADAGQFPKIRTSEYSPKKPHIYQWGQVLNFSVPRWQ